MGRSVELTQPVDNPLLRRFHLGATDADYTADALKRALPTGIK